MFVLPWIEIGPLIGEEKRSNDVFHITFVMDGNRTANMD